MSIVYTYTYIYTYIHTYSTYERMSTHACTQVKVYLQCVVRTCTWHLKTAYQMYPHTLRTYIRTYVLTY